MPRTKGTKTVYFSAVKKAREALRDNADKLLEEYMGLIREARAAQEFQVAEAGLWKVIDHIPPDEEGNRVLEGSTDKVKQIEGQKGPIIQIGIKLGALGSHTPKQLEESTPIEAEVIKSE